MLKKFNLPELVEVGVTSFSRTRILRIEKSVSDWLETGANLLACAELTRESTSATTDLNWLHSISTELLNLLLQPRYKLIEEPNPTQTLIILWHLSNTEHQSRRSDNQSVCQSLLLITRELKGAPPSWVPSGGHGLTLRRRLQTDAEAMPTVKNSTVKRVWSGPVLCGHFLSSGQSSKSRKFLFLFDENVTSNKR